MNNNGLTSTGAAETPTADVAEYSPTMDTYRWMLSAQYEITVISSLLQLQTPVFSYRYWHFHMHVLCDPLTSTVCDNTTGSETAVLLVSLAAKPNQSLWTYVKINYIKPWRKLVSLGFPIQCLN